MLPVAWPDVVVFFPAAVRPLVSTSPAPMLSFVIVARRFRHTKRVLLHLLQQHALGQVEVVLVTESRATFVADDAVLIRFPYCAVIEVGPIHDVSAAIAHGMRSASAPLVVWGEDHAFPAADFAARIIDRAGESWTALGPAMFNANPTASLSWAMLLTSYTDWVEVERGGVWYDLPGHNSCYRREALMTLGDALPRLVRPGGGLHAALRASGAQLVLDPTLRVHHLNPSRLSVAMQHRIDSGWVRSALDARDEGWSITRRLLSIPLFPVQWARRSVWGLRAWRRIRRRELRTANDAARSLTVVCWIVAASGCAALGELVGTWVGSGNRQMDLAEFELDRDRLRSSRDTELVVE